MKVISVASQKGGIGKSTTALAIASILKEKKKKVLLIDADLQCNASDTCRAQIENAPTLYDVLLNDSNPISIQDAIQHTDYVDIIAGDPLLEEGDTKLMKKGIKGYKILDAALKELPEDMYDYVIIDTAPAINMILRNVLYASYGVIVPCSTDRYALHGLEELNISVHDIQEINPTLRILGVLLIKYNDRALLSKDVKESLETIVAQMDTKLFKTHIRESIKVREAQALRVPLSKYAKTSTAEIDYETFVKELLKEIK